ncbi:Atrial natriuretic peptide receptor 2 [Tetrabaena socialis]|uniref:Atrial natriuretic peptide receptor 2 n=1 Tax=Tetrabaena socialis TaxID=47790 RepID=A0A2J8ADA5_9CHLO|nr:Atrial natriuretic peptide receptor 2 [Tetrabaena socialis]|eukprot:PNH10500.1 Atrial natriuretic peptide receptor 2 [Tetrabaena socialis]
MESRKVTDILKRILPLSVVQRLQQGQSMIADAHDEVTVLFADVAGWLAAQDLSARNTGDVVMVLNEMYAAFEKLLVKYQVFRCGSRIWMAAWGLGALLVLLLAAAVWLNWPAGILSATLLLLVTVVASQVMCVALSFGISVLDDACANVERVALQEVITAVEREAREREEAKVRAEAVAAAAGDLAEAAARESAALVAERARADALAAQGPAQVAELAAEKAAAEVSASAARSTSDALLRRVAEEEGERRRLKDIGLPQYGELLRTQEVTPLVLAGMKDKELEALGVETVGARRRILEAAKQYASKVHSTTRMMLLYKDGQASAAASAATSSTNGSTSRSSRSTTCRRRPVLGAAAAAPPLAAGSLSRAGSLVPSTRAGTPEA